MAKKYRLEISPQVAEFMEGLPPGERESVMGKLEKAAENPSIGKLVVEETGIFNKNKPKFCPNCRGRLRDLQPIVDTMRAEGGFDCVCEECGWSGEINPDGLTNLEGDRG